MKGKTTYLLGVDLGTQGVKIALYTPTGEKVWMSGAAFTTRYPEAGRAEQDPFDWWRALREVLKQLPDSINPAWIGGMAVCATSSTVLLVDREGVPVIPAIMWMDTRAINEMAEINSSQAAHVQEILRYSGGKVSVEWMLPKAIWLKNQGLLRPGYKVVEQLDWLNFQLTGKWAASQCNATCKWNYVKQKNGFDRDFFAAIGWSDFAQYWPADVLPVGEQVGTVTAHAAAELGLPAGIPVFQGGIDAHIGMLGVGAVEPGVMSLIMGTSFVHLVHTEKPVFQDGLWGPYQDAVLPDSWLIEGGQLSCGSLISWFLEQYYPQQSDESKAAVYQELIEQAARIEPGSNGLVMMDSWQGNRTPYRNPYATGAVVGLTLAHTKYHLFRAILESVAYGTNNVIRFFRDADIPIERIIACGGGVKNRLWLQMISDVTGVPIEVSNETEAGTKGCAAVSAYGLGCYPTLAEAAKKMAQTGEVYTPDPQAQQAYEVYFQTYLALHQTLFPIMENLKMHEERKDALVSRLGGAKLREEG